MVAGAVICFMRPTVRWWRRRPWRIKGRPLHGATAFVGSITPQPAPPATNEPGDDTQLRKYYSLNVTIRPLGRVNKLPWVPAAIQVVPTELSRPERPDCGELQRYCRIESRELICGSISFQPDDTFVVAGKFDLQLHISVRHDIRALQFRYYLEQFGSFQLPDPISAIQARSDLLTTRQPMTSE